MGSGQDRSPRHAGFASAKSLLKYQYLNGREMKIKLTPDKDILVWKIHIGRVPVLVLRPAEKMRKRRKMKIKTRK